MPGKGDQKDDRRKAIDRVWVKTFHNGHRYGSVIRSRAGKDMIELTNVDRQRYEFPTHRDQVVEVGIVELVDWFEAISSAESLKCWLTHENTDQLDSLYIIANLLSYRRS